MENPTTIYVTDKIRWYTSGLFLSDESRLKAKAIEIPPLRPHQVITYAAPLFKLLRLPNDRRTSFIPVNLIIRITGIRINEEYIKLRLKEIFMI